VYLIETLLGLAGEGDVNATHRFSPEAVATVSAASRGRRARNPSLRSRAGALRFGHCAPAAKCSAMPLSRTYDSGSVGYALRTGRI
jgi:hypothetical protein